MENCNCPNCIRTRILVKILPYAAIAELVFLIILTIYVTTHASPGN